VWLAGSIVTLAVFGLVLALAWSVVLRTDASLRLVSPIVAGGLGLFAGGLFVGLLGRSGFIKRSLSFTLTFSTLSALYVFAFSQVTLVWILAAALIGLLAGVSARQIRSVDRESPT
jgi:hypothetical protein